MPSKGQWDDGTGGVHRLPGSPENILIGEVDELLEESVQVLFVSQLKNYDPVSIHCRGGTQEFPLLAAAHRLDEEVTPASVQLTYQPVVSVELLYAREVVQHNEDRVHGRVSCLFWWAFTSFCVPMMEASFPSPRVSKRKGLVRFNSKLAFDIIRFPLAPTLG